MECRRFVGPARSQRNAHQRSERVPLSTIPPRAPFLPADDSSAPHFPLATAHPLSVTFRP